MIVINEKDIEKAREQIPDKIYEFEELLGFCSNWFEGENYNQNPILFENNERLLLLKLLNMELTKAEQKGTTVNKLTTLYEIKNKLSKSK